MIQSSLRISSLNSKCPRVGQVLLLHPLSSFGGNRVLCNEEGKESQAAASTTTSTAQKPALEQQSKVSRALRRAVQATGSGIQTVTKATLRGTWFVLTNPIGAYHHVRSWYPAVKATIEHYVVGSKLLATRISIAWTLLNKLAQGRELTRSERRLLLTTGADVLRLVPFAIIVIVPFMELTLPLLLRIFPNMLPSTFVDKQKKEEEYRKLLQTRLEVSSVLQETVQEMAQRLRDTTQVHDKQVLASELASFMGKVRRREAVTNDEIIHFSKLFKDDFTLESLSRPQLEAMCRYMNSPTFGTDSILRFQLRNQLRFIKNDDRDIYWEGVDSLPPEDLRIACRKRGIRVMGRSVEALRRDLSRWLELSMNHEIPSSLLILSRAFVFTQMDTAEQVLQATLSTMPVEVVTHTVSETAGADVTNPELRKVKLEALQQEKRRLETESLTAEKRAEYRALQSLRKRDSREPSDVEPSPDSSTTPRPNPTPSPSQSAQTVERQPPFKAGPTAASDSESELEPVQGRPSDSDSDQRRAPSERAALRLSSEERDALLQLGLNDLANALEQSSAGQRLSLTTTLSPQIQSLGAHPSLSQLHHKISVMLQSSEDLRSRPLVLPLTAAPVLTTEAERKSPGPEA